MSRVGNVSRQSTSVLDEELETQIGSRNIRATEADAYQMRDKYFDSQRESETMPETAEVPEPDVEKPPKKLLFSARPGDDGGKPRPKKKKWSMGFIAMGVVAGLGSVGAGVYAIRPQDPIFEVELITLSGFNLRFCTDSPLLLAVVDVSLTLHIKVINPNVTPIVFSSTIMDIYYRGNLLGQAKVHSGDQEARSSKVMEVPAKLDGLEMTNHLKDLFSDVAKREMMLHSIVTISGDCVVWKLRHHFEVRVNSDIKVDPIFLDVLEQENRVHLELEPLI